MTWRATVLTLFPELFPGALGASLAGRALAQDVWSCEAIDIREYATDKHRSVDDLPAGGGPGMVMRADVLARAIDADGAGKRSAAEIASFCTGQAARSGERTRARGRGWRRARVRPL